MVRGLRRINDDIKREAQMSERGSDKVKEMVLDIKDGVFLSASRGKPMTLKTNPRTCTALSRKRGFPAN
jgi:hypothetical protein